MNRRKIKSCCGGGGYILEIDYPISKAALPIFQQAGYKTSPHYSKVGVFFVEKNGFTASSPFGGSIIQVRCGGSSNCSQLLDNLENTFKIIHEAAKQKK